MAMQVKDIMGKVAIAVRLDASFSDLVATMQRFKVGAVTVIDADRRPVGVVSEDDLLLKETDPRNGARFFESARRREERRKVAGATAGQIMTRPAITVTSETSVQDAARLMHTHKIKQLPVIDAVTGRILGTVHQGDLLKIFVRPVADIYEEIAHLLEEAGISPAAVTVEVEAGVVSLTGRIAVRSRIPQLIAAVREIDGVVEVEEDLTFVVDDLARIPPLYQ